MNQKNIREYGIPPKDTQVTLAHADLFSLLIRIENETAEKTKEYLFRELNQRYVPCVYDKSQKVNMNPHYLTSRERKSAYDESGRPGATRSCVTYENKQSPKAADYIYIDRLDGFYDESKKGEATRVANKKYEPSTAGWREIYMSTLMEKTIVINRIITGVGGSGYPWNVIGYTVVE